jgi:mitogen-activated protein kinase 15
VQATDLRTNELVAIKKIKDAFPPNTSELDEETARVEYLIAIRVLRELKILAHLVDCPNVVTLQGIIVPEDYESFRDVYVITDIMPIDLRTVLTKGSRLGADHIRFLTYQLLAALHHIHSTGIIHRDLKPEVCRFQCISNSLLEYTTKCFM